MGKMVNVSGFLTGVSAMKVRYLFERITGSETIHTIGLKETKCRVYFMHWLNLHLKHMRRNLSRDKMP